MGSFRIFPFSNCSNGIAEHIFSWGQRSSVMDFTQLVASYLDTPLYQRWQAGDMSYKWIFMKIRGILDS